MTRLATGVFRDRYGYEIRWQDAGHTKTKRFPKDTPLDTLKDWRKRRVGQARELQPKTGSFVRDAVRFLSNRKGRPGFKSDRAHLRPWVHRFKKLSRWAISRATIAQALDEWRQDGYSPRTLKHRLRVLSALYMALDPESVSPCLNIKTPPPLRPRPVSVPDETIRDVARNLLRSQGAGRLRDAKTRARFLVLATTGQRRAQLCRAAATDLDVERRIWIVRPAKGDAGGVVYLNDDMLAAWRLFIAAKAWGTYDARSFAKTLRRNGWPKGVRPQALRHTVGLALSQLGVDLGDIQTHMGHSSPNVTRQFYVPALFARIKAASEQLDARGLLHDAATSGEKQKANVRETTPLSARQPEQAPARLRHRRSSETA